MALANHCSENDSGGNDSRAFSLNAANVTTTAGSTRKPSTASTTSVPIIVSSRGNGERGMSVRLQLFQWARGQPHQRQDGQCDRQPGDAKACRERKIEAREAELIHQVRDHVDLAAADQLRRGEGAEGPRESRSHAGD